MSDETEFCNRITDFASKNKFKKVTLSSYVHAMLWAGLSVLCSTEINYMVFNQIKLLE